MDEQIRALMVDVLKKNMAHMTQATGELMQRMDPGWGWGRGRTIQNALNEYKEQIHHQPHPGEDAAHPRNQGLLAHTLCEFWKHFQGCFVLHHSVLFAFQTLLLSAILHCGKFLMSWIGSSGSSVSPLRFSSHQRTRIVRLCLDSILRLYPGREHALCGEHHCKASDRRKAEFVCMPMGRQKGGLLRAPRF